MERSEPNSNFILAPAINVALLLGSATFWGAPKQILGLCACPVFSKKQNRRNMMTTFMPSRVKR
jgi:hypothetical protein